MFPCLPLMRPFFFSPFTCIYFSFSYSLLSRNDSFISHATVAVALHVYSQYRQINCTLDSLHSTNQTPMALVSMCVCFFPLSSDLSRASRERERESQRQRGIVFTGTIVTCFFSLSLSLDLLLWWHE